MFFLEQPQVLLRFLDQSFRLPRIDVRTVLAIVPLFQFPDVVGEGFVAPQQRLRVGLPACCLGFQLVEVEREAEILGDPLQQVAAGTRTLAVT